MGLSNFFQIYDLNLHEDLYNEDLTFEERHVPKGTSRI